MRAYLSAYRVTVLGVSLFSSVTLFADERPTDLAPLGVLADGYVRNRESFALIDCKFTKSKGWAKSADDALHGRLLEGTTTQFGAWLVDGSNVRYELRCSPDETLNLEKALEQNPTSADSPTPSMICAEDYYLRNKEYSLHYGPQLATANLFGPGDVDKHGIRNTPFNLDFMGHDEYSSPDRYLRDVLGGRFVGEFVGTETLNGIELLVAKVRTTRGQMKFGFDPRRNYVLAYQADEREGGKPLYEVFLLDAKECANGSWFPMHVVKLSGPLDNQLFMVEDLRVTELETARKPSKDRFTLALEEGTRVSVIGRTEFASIERPQIVGLDDLAELKKRCVAVGNAYLERQRDAAAGPQGNKNLPAGRSWWSVATLTANIALLVVLLCVIAWRRARSAHA